MKNETRREFMKKGLVGAGAVAAYAALGNTMTGAKLKKRPNIVLIITDQQREAQHWPTGWIEEHMPTMARLQSNGVTFTNNFTAATACSPSRATFLTGVYPSLHGLKLTPPDPPLRSDITNIFKLAEQAGRLGQA